MKEFVKNVVVALHRPSPPFYVMRVYYNGATIAGWFWSSIITWDVVEGLWVVQNVPYVFKKRNRSLVRFKLEEERRTSVFRFLRLEKVVEVIYFSFVTNLEDFDEEDMDEEFHFEIDFYEVLNCGNLKRVMFQSSCCGFNTEHFHKHATHFCHLIQLFCEGKQSLPKLQRARSQRRPVINIIQPHHNLFDDD